MSYINKCQFEEFDAHKTTLTDEEATTIATATGWDADTIRKEFHEAWYGARDIIINADPWFITIANQHGDWNSPTETAARSVRAAYEDEYERQTNERNKTAHRQARYAYARKHTLQERQTIAQNAMFYWSPDAGITRKQYQTLIQNEGLAAFWGANSVNEAGTDLIND